MSTKIQKIDTPLFTYWEHPESDCVVAMTPEDVERAFEHGGSDVLCLVELTSEEYLKKIKSPKELPEGIRGILKDAYWWPFAHSNDVICGQLYMDPTNKFPNGIEITTSRVQSISVDNIFQTQHSKYYVIMKK